MSAPRPDGSRPPSADAPFLLLCAHGSRSPAAQRTTARIAAQTAQLLPETEVIETWVDVQTPDVAQRCAQLAQRPAVIVPLLLSAGYHVRHDLAEAVAGRPHHVVVAALGPDPRLSALLSRRLAEVAVPGKDVQNGPIALIAAGSSDERAVADVRTQAEDLARLTGRRVQAGFVSAARPSAAEAVQSLRERTGRSVTGASFLLAPGLFHDQAAQAGAEALSPPLLGEDGAAEEILEIVLERWHEGLRMLAAEEAPDRGGGPS